MLHAGFGAVTGTLGTGIEPVKGLLGGGIHNEGFTKGWKSQVSANRKMRDAMANGSTWVGRRLENISDLTGMTIPGTSEAIETDIHEIDEKIKYLDNKMAPSKKSAEELKLYADAVSAMEKRAIEKIENGEAGKLSEIYRKKQAHIESLKSRLDEQTRSGASRAVLDAIETEIAVSENDSRQFLNDVGMRAYIDSNRGGPVTIDETEYDAATRSYRTIRSSSVASADIVGNRGDATLENLTKKMEEVVSQYGGEHGEMDATFDAAKLHSALGKAKGAINDINIDNEEFEREKRDLGEEKQTLYEKQKARKANRDVTSGK